MIRGDAVDGLALSTFEPVTEIRGPADTWWPGPDSLIAIYAGAAECFDAPSYVSPASTPVSRIRTERRMTVIVSREAHRKRIRASAIGAFGRPRMDTAT